MTERKDRELIEDTKGWIDFHASDLARAMSEFRKIWIAHCIGESRGDANLRFYNPDRRSLFEMPLCKSITFIQDEIDLPTGFYAVNGSVELLGFPWINEDYISIRRFHMFASDRNGFVVDFCAGQFVALPEELDGPGSRTRAIARFAPELLMQCDNGFTALIGERNELSKKLNIRYSDEQLRPNTL